MDGLGYVFVRSFLYDPNIASGKFVISATFIRQLEVHPGDPKEGIKYFPKGLAHIYDDNEETCNHLVPCKEKDTGDTLVIPEMRSQENSVHEGNEFLLFDGWEFPSRICKQGSPGWNKK